MGREATQDFEVESVNIDEFRWRFRGTTGCNYLVLFSLPVTIWLQSRVTTVFFNSINRDTGHLVLESSPSE